MSRGVVIDSADFMPLREQRASQVAADEAADAGYAHSGHDLDSVPMLPAVYDQRYQPKRRTVESAIAQPAYAHTSFILVYAFRGSFFPNDTARRYMARVSSWLTRCLDTPISSAS